MSRRSRRGTVECFPALPEGIQNGLKRLVSDNLDTIAKMLDVDLDNDNDKNDDTTATLLCEKCAQVMKQQQLSAASFLARFFHALVLAEHATTVLQKSGKGSEATLGDRIAAEWAKNKVLVLAVDVAVAVAVAVGAAEEKVLSKSPSKKEKETKPVADTTTTEDDDAKETKKDTAKTSSSSSSTEKKRKSEEELSEPSALIGKIPRKSKNK